MARSVSMSIFTTISVVVIFCYSPTLCEDTCGQIGNTDETETTVSRTQLLYLDTENPATCSGNITNFRVCYYAPENFSSSTTATVYRTAYALYRKTNSSSESYTRVSLSFQATLITSDLTLIYARDTYIAAGYNCYDDVFTSRDSVLYTTVETGDILGACIYEPRDLTNSERVQLDIVGTESGHSLMQTSSDDCVTEDTIPSVISVSDLTVATSKRLLIYANISKD